MTVRRGVARDKREERDSRDVGALSLQSRFSRLSRPSRLSQGSAITAEPLMNNASQVFISEGIWSGAAGGLLDTHFPALVR